LLDQPFLAVIIQDCARHRRMIRILICIQVAVVHLLLDGVETLSHLLDQPFLAVIILDCARHHRIIGILIGIQVAVVHLLLDCVCPIAHRLCRNLGRRR